MKTPKRAKNEQVAKKLDEILKELRRIQAPTKCPGIHIEEVKRVDPGIYPNPNTAPYNPWKIGHQGPHGTHCACYQCVPPIMCMGS